MQSLDYQDFLDIYDDPYWEESISGGLAEGSFPTEFDVDQLYQGTLVELEHTPDPYMAIEIAMDHLTEDPDYYQKLKVMEAQTSCYCRNPRSYGEMSLGELKREERRLLETIDDARYFGEDPQKIEALEAQLTLIRQTFSPGERFVPRPELPETVVQEQLSVLHDEIKTLKSLERTAWDARDAEQAGRYRRKHTAIVETIASIHPLLQKITAGRAEITAAQSKLRSINLELISTEEKRNALSEKLKMSFSAQGAPEISAQKDLLQTAGALQQQVTTLRSAAYQQEHSIKNAHERINIALDIALRDLAMAGYAVQLPAVSGPTIPMRVIESAETISTPPTEVTLPPELTAIYAQLSSDPAIASLQNQLRSAIQELTAAVEDHEPSYIVRRIEAKIAELHAEIERRTAKRHFRR